MTEDQPTLGELGRQQLRLQDRLDRGEFIPKALYDVELRSMREDIQSLQEGYTWAYRLLITSLAGLVFEAIMLAFVLSGVIGRR